MAPPPIPPPPVLAAARPAVVGCYRLWCGFIAAIYLGMLVYGVLIVSGRIEPDVGLFTRMAVGDDPVLRREAIAREREDSIGVVVVSAAGAAFYILGAGVPRRRWGWVCGMVALSLSFFPFMVTAAGMIPLIIFWLKPATKRWFGAG